MGANKRKPTSKKAKVTVVTVPEDAAKEVNMPVVTEALLPEWIPYVMEPPSCTICGGGADEDKMLLCDGPGCKSEIHMYCLRPVVTKVCYMLICL